MVGEIQPLTENPGEMSERRDMGTQGPLEQLHREIDVVVAKMQEKGFVDDAALIAKAHDRIDDYVRYMREWVEQVRSHSAEKVTLKMLDSRMGNPMSDGVEIARRNYGVDPKLMLTPEGEQELYKLLGVLRESERVSDLPRLYKERSGKSDKIDPRDYLVAFPTKVNGVMLRIRKDLDRGVNAGSGPVKSSPFENIELHFSGEETWKRIMEVT